MSSHDNDFLPKQQQQQQQKKRSPQPASGDRANDLSAAGNGRAPLGQPPGNGRMGLTVQGPGMGNWNGNNHLNNEPPPPPPPPLPPTPMGHLMQDQQPLAAGPNGNGHERSHQSPHPRHSLHPDSRDSVSFSRGPMRTPNNSGSSNNSSSSYERHHPYQRPLGHSQGVEPRFAGSAVRPGYMSKAHDILAGDLRAPPPRLR